MSDYFLVNPPLSAANDNRSLPAGRHRRRGNRTTAASVLPQFRCANPNDHLASLTWNILLTDDQDDVSKRFLRMNDEPSAAVQQRTERFGPAIMVVPKNIRQQADELFRPSEIDPNEIFDSMNVRQVSWILPSTYQQYLKSVPPNALERRERHVLYPWTLWNVSTGTSPVVTSDGSSSLSSYGGSPIGNLGSGGGGGSGSSYDGSGSGSGSSYGGSGSGSSYGGSGSGSGSGGDSGNTSSSSNSSGSDASTADTLQSTVGDAVGRQWTTTDMACSPPSPPPQHNFGDDRFLLQQRRQQLLAQYSDRRSPPSSQVRWPTRLYYCVDADNKTINKLVEHYCTFCYKNHEPPEVYGSHLVRDSTRTTCPKLRALRCKHCNATGDNAHTIKYCPFLYSNYS